MQYPLGRRARCQRDLIRSFLWGGFEWLRLSRNDAEAAAMDGLQQKEMFVQKVGASGPLVRSPTNGRASRASLPKSANSEPVTIRPYGRDGRARWKNRAPGSSPRKLPRPTTFSRGPFLKKAGL